MLFWDKYFVLLTKFDQFKSNKIAAHADSMARIIINKNRFVFRSAKIMKMHVIYIRVQH